MGNVGAFALTSSSRTRMPRHRRCTFAAALLIALTATFAGGVAQASAKEQAKREFERGKAAFGAGDFDVALQRYRRAYELVPLPGLLFNIAQCHRNLGNHLQAINFFRLYLAKVPDAPNRAAVEALLVELEKQTRKGPAPPEEDPQRHGQGPDEPSHGGSGPEPRQPDDRVDQRSGDTLVLPPTDPPRPARRRPFYGKWWFWTAVAVAIGGGVAGVYFGTRDSSALPDSRLGVMDVSVK